MLSHRLGSAAVQPLPVAAQEGRTGDAHFPGIYLRLWHERLRPQLTDQPQRGRLPLLTAPVRLAPPLGELGNRLPFGALFEPLQKRTGGTGIPVGGDVELALDVRLYLQLPRLPSLHG